MHDKTNDKVILILWSIYYFALYRLLLLSTPHHIAEVQENNLLPHPPHPLSPSRLFGIQKLILALSRTQESEDACNLLKQTCSSLSSKQPHLITGQQ